MARMEQKQKLHRGTNNDKDNNRTQEQEEMNAKKIEEKKYKMRNIVSKEMAIYI